MKSNTYYIYELWNPINDSVFYVGKGTKYNNSYYRLSNHIKDSKYAKSGKIPLNHKFNTILQILDLGKTPIIKIIYESSDINAIHKKEIEMIKFYGRKDNGTGILTNHTDGGEGMLGYKHTPEHIERLKTNNAGGNATARPIYSIDPVTFAITRYKSVNYAAKSVNGTRANIHSSATKFKNRIVYGYYWRFVDDYNQHEDFELLNKNRDKSFNSAKPVKQLNSEGHTVNVWNSASDVCRYYNKSVSTLARHIGSNKKWNGWFWDFA